MKRLFLASIIFLFQQLLLTENSVAQSTSWKGTTSTAWATATNWTNGAPTASLDVIIGDVNFTGAFQPSITATSTAKSLTIGKGSITSTLTKTALLTVSGNVSIGTKGTIADNSTLTTTGLTIGGTGILSDSGTYTTSNNNATITFAGTTQSFNGSISFSSLTINAGSVVTLNSNITVNYALNLTGTLDPNEPTHSVNLNSAIIFSLASGSILKVKASTFAGNYSINPTSVSSASTVQYAAATQNQTVSNSFSYGNLQIAGAMTASLPGNLPGVSGNLTVSSGTFDLLEYTANRSSAGGTITVSNGADLKFAGNNPFPANYSTITLGASSTVEYYGFNQTVVKTTYGNLTLTSDTSAATKTMPTTSFTIAGNFTSNVTTGTSLSITAGNKIVFSGNISIGASTTFNASTFAHTLSGNFVNNGTFTSTTGTLTMNGASKSISGSGTTTFCNLTITGSGITAASGTSFTISGTFTATTGTFTHTAGGAGIITMSGSAKKITGNNITFSNLTITGTISTTYSMTVAGNFVNSNSFTATAGTITLSGTSASVSGAGATFKVFLLTVPGTITCSTSLTVSSTSLTVNGSFTASAGTVTFGGAAQSITGTGTISFYGLTVNTGSTITLNCNIAVTNAFSITGTFDPGTYTVTLTGATTFALNAASVTRVKASTFAGNYTISPTTINATSTVQYASTSINQTVSNSLTYGNLTYNGTMTASLAGNLPAIGGNLTVSSGTLDLLTYTANRSASGGTVTVSNGADLKIGGTNPFPTNFITRTLGASSTIEYYGTNQTVVATTYGNLILSSSSGAAVKTMPVTAFTVAGSLTSSVGGGTSVSYTAGNNITITGAVTIGASTTFAGSSYSLSFAGNFANSGTFTSTTGTATFTGVSKSISGGGTTTFNNLTITGAGITVSSSTSLTVSGNLSTSGTGTFTHTSGGAGIITLSGTSKTISGTGITFSNLTISGTISTAVALTIAGNFTMNNTFATTAATTLTGSSGSISGSGSTFTMTSLTVQGTYTCSIGFTLSSDLSVTVSLTASAGTITFNGTSNLSGTANLYNITINGTSLIMGGSANLGIAGTFTITAGTFNVTTNIPNTVTFNGSGAQTVNGITYYTLTLANGGTKTAGGAITLNGSLTINSGVTFSAGSYTHSFNRNITNSGTFTAGTSTITMVGSIDATITGATSFNILTVNKSASTNIVTLNNNIAATTVNMTTGSIQTGSNTLTITSARTGNGIILGTITLSRSFTTGTGYAFESPYNTITFTAVSGVTSVTETVTSAPVNNFPYGACVNREYVLSVPSGTYTANMRLHYQASELNGNFASVINIWKYTGGNWADSGKSSCDTVNNYVERDGLSNIVGAWTFSQIVNAATWTGAVSTAWENAANWAALGGSPSLPPSTADIAELGDGTFTNQPVITSAVNVRGITFKSSTAVNLTIGSGGSLTSNGNLNGNVNGSWTGNAIHTFNVGAQTMIVGGSLVLSDGTTGHAINVNVSTGTVSVSGGLYQLGGANVTFSGNGTLNVGSDYIYTNGTFTPSTGTVNYNGTGSQSVAGLSYYNLTINKPSGQATNTATVNVSNNLTLSNAAFYQTSDSLLVSGNVTINSGTTFKGNNANILVGGNWTNNGTFTASVSTFTANGAGAQTIGATTFNNFSIIKSGGTATLSGNVSLNGNLNLTSGTLDVSTYTCNRSSAGGSFIISPGATLKVGGASNFPGSYTTNTISTGSTVEYNGTVAQTVNTLAYGNLTFTNGTFNAKTLSGATTVAGNLLINSGATFSASSYALGVQGNWTNSGTFTASTSTVTLSGASNTLTGATTFNILNVSGNYTGANDITVSGAATITGSYSAGTTTTTFSGDFINSGVLSGSGTITFSGTGAQSLQIDQGISTTGTVNFNGSVAPSITSTNSPTFYTLNINNTGGITPVTGWSVNATCTIGSGAIFSSGAYTHTFYGTFTNNGTITNSDTLNFLPSSPVTITLLGTAFTSTGMVVFSGSNAITLSGTLYPGTITNVIVMNSASITLPSSWTVGGTIYVDPTSTLSAGTSLSHTFSGTLDVDGTFSGGTSTVTMNGGSGSITGSGTISFYSLTIGSGGSVIVSNDITISKDFTNNATFSSTGSNVTFTGALASTIGGSTTPTTIDVLTINKAAATATLSVNLGSVSYLDISSGTLDVAAKTITQVSGGTMEIDSSAQLNIGGTNNISTFSTYTFDPASTVQFDGSSQTLSATPVYGNLIIATSGTTTAAAALTVANDFTLSSGTFKGGNYVHSLQGNWTMSGGTFTNTNTTILFNGTGNSYISSTGAFNNVTVNVTDGTVYLSSNITVNGVLTFTSGEINTGANTVIIPTAGSVSVTSGYILGNEQRAFAAGNLTRVFDIGDANSYSPVSVTFSSISVAGNLIATVTSGNHPDIINSSVNPNADVNKYWTLTNSGITFTNYSASFTFASSDITGGANTANFIVARRTAGAWTFPTVGTKTSTSTQCTGNTAVGDFQVGLYGQKVWTGNAGTNNWGDAANWNPSGAPATTDNVVLTGANTINVNVAAVCKDLTLNNSGLTLSILSSQSLSPAGNFTLTAGTLNTAVSFPSVTGSVTITGGTVGYNGSGAQIVAANNYNNLTLSNAGVKTFASGTSGIAGSFTISGTASANTTTNSTTIDYNLSGNQNIVAINYYNIILDSSGTKTFNSGTVGVAGTLSLFETATVDALTNSTTANYNGSGAQSVVPLSYYNLTLSNAGTKTFQNGNSSVYNSFTISGTASADLITNTSSLNFNGAGAQTIPAATYYDLTYSNGGTKTLSGAITINDILTLSGATTFDVSNSNYGVTILNNWVNNSSATTTFNAQSGTVTFNGTTTISGSANTSFKNITINSGKTLTAGSATTTIAGNLANNGTFNHNSGTVAFSGTTTISGSSTNSFYNLTISGTLNAPAASMNVTGAFANSGTFNAGTGTIVFNGSGNQNIQSGGSAFYNVSVSNSAGVTNTDNLTISNNLVLGTGNITTNANKVIVTNTASSAVSGFSSSSYINGNLREYILTNTSTYSFPVGTASKYTLASIANHNLSGVTYIDASFGAMPGSNAGMSVTVDHSTYTSINSTGVWFLTPDAEPSAGTYDLKCYLSAFTGLSDNTFSILSRPTASTLTTDWNRGGGTLNTTGGLGRKVSDGYALRLNLNTFSQKGIGQSGSLLPIELTNFNAKAEGVNALLNWSTASETDNDYFDVELATLNNGYLSFEKIGEVKGAGTSEVLSNYGFSDDAPGKSGIRYYRLKQVNLDSSFTYSEIKSVEFNNAPFTISQIFPNPSDAVINFDINASGVSSQSISIINSLGQLIYTQTISLAPGNNHFTENISQLPAGIYFLRVINEQTGNQYQRFIKE